MWNDLLISEFPDALEAKMRAIAGAEISEIQDHPDLDDALLRISRRKAEQFAAETMGLAPQRKFPTVYDFFDDYLRPAYQVQDTSQINAWCGRWWDHPSVLFRVNAMWRAYEYQALTDPARADETFLRSIGDHHMRFLLGETSPMTNCKSHHSSSQNLDSDPMEDDDE